MSLELLLNIICDLAVKRNLVNYAAAGPSIYALNNETIKDYPFIFVSPTNNVVTRKNFTDFSVTLFYVDRLLMDMTNETHIFSIANDTIVNLCRQLKSLNGIIEVSEPSVRLFTDTERMTDRCAGGYSEITITVLNDAECPIFFDETGEAMGTYIPQTLQDLDVLDSLASKAWVRNYVAEHSGGSSGGTDEQEVKRLIRQALRDYTKTKDFATINGSGITSGQTFSLVETDTFNTAVENIYAAISASTPADYAENVAKIAKNTDDIAALSGTTSGLSSDIYNLSAYTATLTAVTATLSATTADLAALSAATSAVSVQVETLSGDTSDLRAFLGDLSGFTYSAVSATTQEIEALSGATGAALSGKQDTLVAGSGITISGNTISATGGDKVYYINLSGYTSLSESDRQPVWEEYLAKYQAGYQLFVVGVVNGFSDIATLPLVKYEPKGNQNNAYVGFLNFSSKDTSQNEFLDIILYWSGKLNGITNGKFQKKTIYTLPKANASTLGGIKVGSGLTVDNNGVLSTAYQIWSGTQAQYTALGTYDNNTLYIITDANT